MALKGDITEDTGVIADGGTANGGGAEGSFSATFHGLTPLTEAEDDVNARVAPGAVLANSTPTSATAPWPAASARASSRPCQADRVLGMRP